MLVAVFCAILLRVTAVCLLCLVVHEVGHIIAMCATGAGQLQGVVVSPMGIGIKWDQVDPQPHKLIVVAAAGPAANIIVAIVAVVCGCPALLVISQIVYGLVNLCMYWIPESDGGKVVHYARIMIRAKKKLRRLYRD